MRYDIKIEHLSVAYNGNNILKDVYITIPYNSIVSVIGRNGIGKSTLACCISRKVENYSGDIYINEQNIKDFSIEELSRIVSVLYSHSTIYNNLNVKDFLVMGFANEFKILDKPNKNHFDKAYQLLKFFKKEYIFDKAIFSLSSGELQIAKLVKVLLQDTPIIILDEPTENLDIENQLLILDLIEQLHNKGKTIIMITHNLRHMFELKSKCLFLNGNDYVYCNSKEVIENNIINKFISSNISYLKDNYNFVIKVYNNKKVYI